MPTPAQALVANLEYILNPFYRRGPGDLGIGWLLLASLRRVLLGFKLGALVAIPVGFLIGISKKAMLALNPIIQQYSLLPWLTVRKNIRLAVDKVLKNATRAEKNQYCE